MHKPKHVVRGLLSQIDAHQKAFVIHTIILLILLLVFPIINLTAIQSSTVGSETIGFFSLTFWKSDFIVLSMIVSIWLVTFHEKIRQMIVAAFGVSDVFINFVCYLVIIATYIGIGDATMAVHQGLTKTIGLANGYYVIGLWLAIGLFLHASWSYKQGKKSHQATIINLAAQKHNDNQQRQRESFKNLFD